MGTLRILAWVGFTLAVAASAVALITPRLASARLKKTFGTPNAFLGLAIALNIGVQLFDQTNPWTFGLIVAVAFICLILGVIQESRRRNVGH